MSGSSRNLLLRPLTVALKRCRSPLVDDASPDTMAPGIPQGGLRRAPHWTWPTLMSLATSTSTLSLDWHTTEQCEDQHGWAHIEELK